MRIPSTLRLIVLCVASSLCASAPAFAFTHVVQKGETLAGIAERLYGRIQYEGIIVHANALDACGGTPIIAGMRLEIPAVSHRRVSVGETWATIAKELLGDERRGEVLAQVNGGKPWVPPEIGAEIVIPYNLRFIVRQTDTIVSIASRFFADKESAWMLDRYNDIDGHALRRGDVVLVPLTDLPLTDAGKAEASPSEAATRSEAAGAAREAQRKTAAELPMLFGEVRGGHYLDAIIRANRLLALGELSQPQVADINRVLVEAYVALDAVGLAASACSNWRKADTTVTLDPLLLSPKIVSACTTAMRPQ